MSVSGLQSRTKDVAERAATAGWTMRPHAKRGFLFSRGDTHIHCETLAAVEARIRNAEHEADCAGCRRVLRGLRWDTTHTCGLPPSAPRREPPRTVLGALGRFASGDTRRHDVIKLIRTMGPLSTAEICAAFGVSDGRPTVRNVIREAEARGEIRRRSRQAKWELATGA